MSRVNVLRKYDMTHVSMCHNNRIVWTVEIFCIRLYHTLTYGIYWLSSHSARNSARAECVKDMNTMFRLYIIHGRSRVCPDIWEFDVFSDFNVIMSHDWISFHVYRVGWCFLYFLSCFVSLHSLCRAAGGLRTL